MERNDLECCKAVGAELQKVQTKFGAVKKNSQCILEDLISNLEALQKDLPGGSLKLKSLSNVGVGRPLSSWMVC